MTSSRRPIASRTFHYFSPGTTTTRHATSYRVVAVSKSGPGRNHTSDLVVFHPTRIVRRDGINISFRNIRRGQTGGRAGERNRISISRVACTICPFPIYVRARCNSRVHMVLDRYTRDDRRLYAGKVRQIRESLKLMIEVSV